jgi:hypothetical protein
MRHRLIVGTAVLLPVVGAALITTPSLFGQPSSLLNSIHAVDEQHAAAAPPSGLPNGPTNAEQVLQGRLLVASSGCSDCHNRGKNDPSDPGWLAGYLPGTPGQPFEVGPFKTYAANLTPDKDSGLGKVSERQIFNALRYGLDPKHTPDVVITSTVPGQGNFPAAPEYLAPPMPWPAFRHKTDEELWAIVAYVKHGIKPVANAVPESEGPPDHWAGAYTAEQIGPYPLPPYPAGNETFVP